MAITDTTYQLKQALGRLDEFNDRLAAAEKREARERADVQHRADAVRHLTSLEHLMELDAAKEVSSALRRCFADMRDARPGSCR
jgi:hypothetical protein